MLTVMLALPKNIFVDLVEFLAITQLKFRYFYQLLKLIQNANIYTTKFKLSNYSIMS